MASVSVNSILSWLRPSRLTGPLFDKELRVLSRRRRTYAVRVAYLAALALFVGVKWASVVAGDMWQADPAGIYRLADAIYLIIC